MLDMPVVSWRDICGNKYSKSLDPAMLMAHGYPLTTKAKVIGKTGSSELITVVYDRDYVINYLITKVIKPLSNYGLQEVTNLLLKAWEESNFPKKSFVSNSLVNEE